MLIFNKITFLSLTAGSAIAYFSWTWFHNETKENARRDRMRKKKLKHSIPGLVNVGNSCFMNALLQCMASQTSFVDWLEKVCKSPYSKKCNLLAETMYSLMCKLYDERDNECFDPSYLLTDMCSRGWHISGDENDAHELFHCIMMTLDSEITYQSKDASPSLACILDNVHSKHSDDDMLCKLIRRRPKLPFFCKWRKHPYHGLLSVRLHCSQCGKQNPITFESFDSLSVPIMLKSRNTLVSCIQDYFACEIVHGVHCANCTIKKEMKLVEPGGLNASNNSVEKKPSKSVSQQSCCFETLTTGHLLNKISDLALIKSLEPPIQLCDNNNNNTCCSFYKYSHVSKLPQSLCIHLQRLVWKHNQPIKLCNFIQFPEILDFGQFLYTYNSNAKPLHPINPIFLSLLNRQSHIKGRLKFGIHDCRQRLADLLGGNFKKLAVKQSTKHLYQLNGIIVHLGDWNFNGHFIAYRRHVLKNKEGNVSVQWFFTSDTYVRKAALDEVLAQPAYMLFYERLSLCHSL